MYRAGQVTVSVERVGGDPLSQPYEQFPLGLLSADKCGKYAAVQTPLPSPLHLTVLCKQFDTNECLEEKISSNT